MSITNYSELQASVASWLNRGDLTANITDFITLAEAQLNTDLKARAMDAKTTLPTVVGVSTVALPSDMLGMRRLQVVGTYNQPLSYRSPDELSIDFAANTSGQPVVFTVVGGNAELAPIPDAVYSLELTYQQKIPALSVAAPTNWLLTNWPNAYLYAALLAATPFIMNDARLPVWGQLYAQAVDGINNVDWYSGSTMKVRAR
ncbi:hypothetical protein [Pseudomonas sp. BGI-2]|uniref:phage adaptor protein n=1 Tax=Pseudomonas sp. BGI-2 TaxID=2528211 RepID=UPI0010339892|nr:hypothetical protein [Pseudomonas sp. BGI-2]TBN49179.1 hypothetical protein EYC95_06470 [Pseudomonas sp. BGI-2]